MAAVSPRVAVSVIIPFFNEAETLPSLVEEVIRFSAKNRPFDLEYIFVDDGSYDRSFEILQTRLPVSKLKAKVLKLAKNFGSHAALRAGISVASGEIITFMYADLQDPLGLIDSQYEKLEQGYDIVWAAREVTGSRHFERLISSVYANLMKRYVDARFPDKGFDVVMFRRPVAIELNQNIEAHSSVFLQILTLGFRQTSVVYEKRQRLSGTSKWTFGKKFKLLVDSFIAFSYAPIRLVSLTGILFFICGALWTVYLIARKLVWNDLEPGWPMMMSILLLGFGTTNISLGIIAEYLWRTLDQTRKRPVFIVDKILDVQGQS